MVQASSTNAQLASQTAATNFIADYFNTPDFWTVKQSASRVISAINSWLYQQGRHDSTRADGYVTTFSALIIKSHTAHVLHTGDSRIYLLRNNNLELLTRDHSYKGANQSVLSRALGIEPRLELDYTSLQVQLGDRFILTTDGVHDTLSSSQLITLFSQPDTLEQVALNVGKASIENGSQDNISCLLVEVNSLPVKRLEEVHQNLAELTIPPVLKPGNTIDNFEIVRSLHSGTRSHVYLAKSTVNDELRVLKMPSASFTEDDVYLELFSREQWIGRKLDYSGIMKIYAPSPTSKFLYHCCEYLPGATLRQWMIDNPSPDINQVREILDGMIRVVRILHRNKMVHRDLKPENFIIDGSGVVSLIDFGTMKIAGIEEISQDTGPDLPLGDMAYIAPETLVHATSDTKSDLFSIATIVYEMLSDQLPYKVMNARTNLPRNFEPWRYKPLNQLTKSGTHIPNWVDIVLQKALQANPNYRYQSMSEMQHDLTSPSKAILTSSELKPLLERNPLVFWKGLSFALFILVVIQWWLLTTCWLNLTISIVKLSQHQ